MSLLPYSTYPELLAAVRHRHPQAEELAEDEEISQLHDLLALLRLGHIRVDWEDLAEGRLLMLHVLEE